MKKVKLFCIPHAGGSAAVYARWKKYLNEKIELIPLELKGRGMRISQKKYKSLNEAILDVANIIEEKVSIDEDYMIYGHSMGCTIAYEACCKIIEDGRKKPIHIFLSGRQCPSIEKEEKQIYKYNDEDFKKAILDLGGTPEEVFDNEKLKEIFVPIMRSDYKNIETFKNIHKDMVLPVPITVLNGKDDDLSDEEINGWSKFTNKNFKRVDFEGGHFFLHERIEEVVGEINGSI